MTTLVLTVIGDDQSGLVEAVAGAVAEHGGNWDRSSMARLGTKFAGIVEVSVPEPRVDALVDDLGPLEEQGLLDITVERVEDDAVTDHDGVRWTLHLIGQDRPGIVHELAQTLAGAGVSIDELHTSTTSGAMSAETMFEADAVLAPAADTNIGDVETALEAIADELMVDIDLSD